MFGPALFFAVLLLSSLGTPAAGQTIRGRVLDATSGEIVPAAAVTVLGPDERPAGRTHTGRDGSFVLPLRGSGAYRLRAERTGYQPTLSQVLEVGARETLEVELRLSAEPLKVEPLTVTGRRTPPRVPALEMNGFYRREQQGSGHHLRREDLERQSNTNLAQVLDRIPGTYVYRDKHGRQYLSFSRAQSVGTFSRAQRKQTDICLPKIYLDGSLITYVLEGPTINDFVQPEQVEAIELYRSASEVPIEYNSNAACGVILLWTRTRS